MVDRAPLGLDPASFSLVVAALTAIGLRLLDYLLPKGHHFKWVRRFATPDHDRKHDDTDPDEEDQ